MKLFKRQKDPDLPPEFLIVGLGNPGPQYSGTRHNVGFDVVEFLAKKNGVALKTHRFQAQYGLGMIDGRGVALAKPLTWMNLSGQAVSALARHFRIEPERILVVSDDLDMEVGRVRMKPKGSAGGHNGHRSIIQSLGTDLYPRIKIGIGKGEVGREHVLNRFPPDQRKTVDEAVEKSAAGCEIWIAEGIENAMNRVNPS